jgi:hypothetical protein
MAGLDQSSPYIQLPGSQLQQLPSLTGPGTKSGPYQGFASKAWLQVRDPTPPTPQSRAALAERPARMRKEL